MTFTTLVDVAMLAAHQGAADWVVIDCRFELGKPAAGQSAYAAGHIPGARYAHLDHDLAGPIGPTTGRHPLPDPATFAVKAGAWGIDRRTQVVVYDQGNSFFAARAWWLFRWLGHTKVAVLDGGIAAWTAAGHPLSSDIDPCAPKAFDAEVHDELVASLAEVERDVDARVFSSVRRLVDARGADRFAGENETIDPVGGHVPGAVNHHYARNYGAEGRLLEPAALRSLWQDTLAGTDPCNMIAMCGSGVSACVNLLALEHAGIKGARLYPGSWSEWVRDPSRPVAKGN